MGYCSQGFESGRKSGWTLWSTPKIKVLGGPGKETVPFTVNFLSLHTGIIWIYRYIL